MVRFHPGELSKGILADPAALAGNREVNDR
jgi:hypothetical protein